MNKIRKQTSLGPDWWTLDGNITKSDLKFEFGKIRYSEIGKYYSADVKILLGSKLQKCVADIVDGKSARFNWDMEELLKAWGFGGAYRYDQKVDYTAADFSCYINVHVDVKLKNVRTESTRKVRHDDAKALAKSRLHSDSQWMKDRIAAKVEHIDSSVKRFIGEKQDYAMRGYVESLRGYDKWAEYVDEREDVSKEKAAIESIESQIDELQAQADLAYAVICEKRGAAWVRLFEKDDWKIKTDDGDVRIPDALIEKTHEMVASGDAFGRKARHHRRHFLD